MSGELNSSVSKDPLSLLGLASGATEEEVRSRYLELVRQFPPERDPAKFQEIRAAYQAASDPLVIARQLIAFNEDEPRPWSEIIAEQKANPPRMVVDVLLSLGNRVVSSESNESLR